MYSYEHEMKEKQEQHIRFIDIFKKNIHFDVNDKLNTSLFDKL